MTAATPSTGFRSGSGTAIVGRSSSVLIATARPALVDELWPLVDTGADVDVLLEALSAEGLRTTGAFAFARVEPGGVRIVVRGDAVASVQAPAGEQRFEARGIRTWAEHFVEGAISFTLAISEPDAGTGGYHLDRGVVPAVAIAWPHEAASRRTDPEASPANSAGGSPTTDASAADTADAPPADSAGPIDGVVAVPEVEAAGVPRAESVVSGSREDVVEQSATTGSESPPTDTLHPSQYTDPTDGESPTGVAPDSPAGRPEPMTPVEAEQPVEPVAPPVESAPPASPPVEPFAPPDDGDYDSLYGHTVHRSVQQAAVVPETDDADESDDADDADVGPGLAEPGPAGPGPARPAPVGPEPTSGSGPTSTPPSAQPVAASTGLIAGVPISGVPNAGPVPAGAPPTGDSTEGDHDGMTISAAQLRAMRGANPTPVEAPAAAMGGPTVQAVVCRSGHQNPPQRSTCRMCTEVLDGVPQIVPRPSMGRVVLSTGEVVELTRPAVIGRNPKIEGRLTGEVPRTVKLEVGQALSRSHTMIRIEGWQVLVEDLGSANGTFVTLPGRPQQRLHPGEPVMLEPGSVIDLGGEVTGTYDAAG